MQFWSGELQAAVFEQLQPAQFEITRVTNFYVYQGTLNTFTKVSVAALGLCTTKTCLTFGLPKGWGVPTP